MNPPVNKGHVYNDGRCKQVWLWWFLKIKLSFNTFVASVFKIIASFEIEITVKLGYNEVGC